MTKILHQMIVVVVVVSWGELKTLIESDYLMAGNGRRRVRLSIMLIECNRNQQGLKQTETQF
jgi:hypothetical protein